MKLLFTACLFATAAPALAENATAPAPAPAQAKTGPGDRVVCRTENEIGSLVRKKKICMTVSQWREVQFQSGSAVERRSTQVSRTGGG